MPHTPQTAFTRLLQSVTDARNIVPGDRIEVRPQLIVLGPRDGLAALKAFRLAGGDKLADASRVVLFSDDNLPTADASQRKQLLEAATQAGIRNIIAGAGCEIVEVIERALVVPGELAVSNLVDIQQLGGIGALGLRVSIRDLAGLMAGKPLPLTVPQSVRVDLTGQRQPLVSGRDAFFALVREVGRDRLAGRALEVGGTGLEGLKLHERVRLCAQAAHAGLAGVFCLPDRAGVAELNQRISRPYTTIEPEKDAAYSHRAALDLANAQMSVMPPEGMEASRTVGEVSGVAIKRVVIGGQGSCGLEDMRTAVDVIKQRRLGRGVRCDLIPNSREVYARALKADVVGQLVDAGVELHPPGTDVSALLQTAPALVTGVVAPTACWRAGVTVAATAACAATIVHPERLDALPQRDSKLSGRRPKPS